MCWSEFNHARPEFWINVFICYDREFALAPQQFNFYFFTNPLLIAFVAWVHSNGCVSEHWLRPHGGDYKWPVLHVVERVYLVAVFNLDIGKARAAMRAPVYNAVASVDVAIGFKSLKRFVNSLDNVVV